MKTKFILSFLFFACCAANLSAQTNWLWAKDAATAPNGTNGCTSVTSDSLGNVFATGWFGSSTITFGSITLTNTTSLTSSDMYIAKYDPNGNVLWAKKIGGSGDEYGYSVSTDRTGNVYVTGWFTSSTISVGSFTLTNGGTFSNIFLVKYDPNGNVLWATSAGGTGYDNGLSVSTDNFGNVFLTGSFSSSSISFGSTVLTNSGSHQHVFIAKYDANGNALWAKSSTTSYTNGDFSYAVTTDLQGDAIISGYYCGANITFGSTTLTNVQNGAWDIFLVKYDSTGNVVWAKTYGGANDEIAYSLSCDTLGNIYMTGNFGSPTVTFGPSTLNLSFNYGIDMFYAKFDVNGNALWAKSDTGTNAEFGWSISVHNLKNIFVTGSFYTDTMVIGSFTLIQPPGTSYNMFIIKFDDNGNIVCASSLGSGWNGNNGEVYVCSDPLGNAFVGGEFMANPFPVGADTLTPGSTGGQDVFVAKYQADCFAEHLGVNEIKNEYPISIFPNPSNGIFTLKWDGGQGTGDKGKNCTVEIYNSLGQIVYQSKLNSSTSTIDLSNEANGIYFVNVKTENKSFSQKIIIQN